MSSQPPNPPDGGTGQPETPRPDSPYSQELHFSQVSARVPEKVGRGVFSTGALVLQGGHEFILDFVLRVAKPHQVVARVILPPSLLPNLLNALRENLDRYRATFGPPPALPAPPPGVTPPPLDEIYAQLKLPDEMIGGVYANAVLIVHTPAEFCFDFITACYPRSVVSSRVYLSAPQVPGLLNTLTHSFQQYQQRLAAQQHRPPEQRPPEQRPPTA